MKYFKENKVIEITKEVINITCDICTKPLKQTLPEVYILINRTTSMEGLTREEDYDVCAECFQTKIVSLMKHKPQVQEF